MRDEVRRQRSASHGENGGQSLGAPASDSARCSPRFLKPPNPRSPEPRELVAAIKREFEKAADRKYGESIQRFFKEPIEVYGVRTADARRISNEYYKKVKHLPKRDIFEICEVLHQGTKYEEHGVAFSWAGRLSTKLEPADFGILERWLKKYVSNWAACDTFCGGPLGEFLIRFPQFLPNVQKWARSENRWLRRASAVTLIPAVKKEKYLPGAYKTADILLEDEDDMVQKGYGWLLKEIANKRPEEVLDFVMKRKDRMPRTALRYAIEKMPPAWKKRAMAD